MAATWKPFVPASKAQTRSQTAMNTRAPEPRKLKQRNRCPHCQIRTSARVSRQSSLNHTMSNLGFVTQTFTLITRKRAAHHRQVTVQLEDTHLWSFLQRRGKKQVLENHSTVHDSYVGTTNLHGGSATNFWWARPSNTRRADGRNAATAALMVSRP